MNKTKNKLKQVVNLKEMSSPQTALAKTIPTGLRRWFLVHFAIDMIFAVPLLFTPAWLLALLGFEATNLLLARIIGAALVGIGGTSLFMHKKDTSAYLPMLQLKLLWSSTVIVAILLSLNAVETNAIWFLLGIFTSFFLVWLYYLKLLTWK